MQHILADLFERDLQTFADNISKVPENKIWYAPDGVTNSAGILAQHIVGNLMHYIGVGLGNIDYQRDRDREFSNTGRTSDSLVTDIKKVRQLIPDILRNMTDEQLAGDYPLQIPFSFQTKEFLLHLYGHLSYHLGQVNYLRRMLVPQQ